MATSPTPDIDRSSFPEFRNAVRDHFANATAQTKALFRTGAPALFDTFLDNLPAHRRQEHNCKACQAFLTGYGGVVTIDDEGSTRSPLWEGICVPSDYQAAVDALRHTATTAAVTDVFFAHTQVWGRRSLSEWTHLTVDRPAGLLRPDALSSPFQATAAKREDHRIVAESLGVYSKDTIAQGLLLVQSASLHQAEQIVKGPLTFLADLQDTVARLPRAARPNLLWKAVATAPPGFCRPRSTMVGALLDDIAAGMPFDQVKRRFEAKVHPLLYQRPQASPKAGNIEAAEKVVARLGIAPSLERRFARFEEMQLLWQPASAGAESGLRGVFAHLREAAKPSGLVPPAQKITWEKFQREVLPKATAIECETQPVMDFAGVLTATHPEAPPILLWDQPERRNPVSHYVYSGGSAPARWGLAEGKRVRVTGVSLLPPMWDQEREYPSINKGALFLLEGAWDHNESSGLCLFPVFLKAELHSIRSTIEAHSKSQAPTGRTEASACGLLVSAGTKEGTATFAVTVANGTLRYTIDRWD